MTRSREGLFRRLGRALRGVQAIEYGRPVPMSDLEHTGPPPAPEIVVEPPRPTRGEERPEA